MRSYNPTLLGLRGLLALSVVVYHIFESAEIEGYIAPLNPDSWAYFVKYAGPLAVDLFFVISGYLIAQSLSGKRSVREFARNRIIRIYPVFLVIHLLIFTVGPVIGYKWMANLGARDYVVDFAVNALLLPGMFDLRIAQIVAWSLSYELFFYVAAGAIWFVAKNGKGSGFARVAPFAVLLALCGVMVYYRVDMLFFAVGVAVYLGQRGLARLWRPNRMAALNGLLWLAFMVFSFRVFDRPLVAVLPLSFLFFLTIVFEHGWLSRLLRTWVMAYLGRISFSLYMWHTMVMYPLKKIMPKIAGHLPGEAALLVVYGALAVGLSLIVSHVSFQLLESKFSAHLKSRMTPRVVQEERSLAS